MLFSNCYLWDYILFVCTFYSCKVVGILPLQVDGEQFTIQGIIQKTANFQNDQTSHKITNIFGVFYIVLILIISVFWLFPVIYLGTGDDFAIPFLPLFCLALIVICTSLFKRRQSTVKCIHTAAQIYCMTSPSLKPCWSVFIFLVFSFLAFIAINLHFLYDIQASLFKTLTIQILILPSVSACLLICCLCLIGERGYRSINLQLQQLSGSQPIATNAIQLDILMYHHEKLTDYMEEINNCFNYDLVAFLAQFMLQLIIFSIRFSHKFDKLIHVDIIIISITLYYTVMEKLKFFMICTCSQQTSNQVKLMRINLFNIQVQWLSNRNPHLEAVLNDFSEAVDARPVVLNAAGFTDINLSLLFKLIGTAVMYTSAALQYHWKDSMTE